jgi:tetratricopeptide (TPR) repeat protein
MQQAANRIKAFAKKKEKQLTNTEGLLERLRIVKEIVHYYMFTDLNKAKEYLRQLRSLAEDKGPTEYFAYYHAYSAFVENQLYNYNRAIAHLQKAKVIFQEEGYNERLADLYVDFAGAYFNLNMLEESDMCLENATRLIKIHPDPYVEARLLYHRAILYTRKYIFEKSIDLFLEARRLLERKGRTSPIKKYHALAQVYSGLGFIYNKVDKLQESVDAYLQVIHICETFGFGMRLAWYYLHLGNAFSSVGKYKKAGKYFRKAITETPQDPSEYAKAGASANLGQLYFIRGNYKSALAMYDYAEKIYSQREGLDDDFNFSVLERYRAQLHAELENEDKALQHYITALEYAIKSNDYKQMSAIYRDLAEFYEEHGEYQQAYEFQIKYSESREKYIDEEKARAFTEMEVKYETERKDRETEFLRLQTTELQLKALRAQMNPHFIFNSLNSIQGYITGYNPDKAAIFFAKFSRLIRNSLEYSEFDVIPLEDEVQFIEDYLELEKERFKGDFDYSINISDDVEEDIMGIPPMIIQPYIENAIKHGVREVKNGFVKIHFSLENDDTYLCSVEDNGIGRELAAERQKEYQTKSHRSMGTMITRQRLELINQASGGELSTRTIDLIDAEGHPAGTRVEIRIPIMDIDQRFYE